MAVKTERERDFKNHLLQLWLRCCFIGRVKTKAARSLKADKDKDSAKEDGYASPEQFAGWADLISIIVHAANIPSDLKLWLVF